MCRGATVLLSSGPPRAVRGTRALQHRTAGTHRCNTLEFLKEPAFPPGDESTSPCKTNEFVLRCSLPLVKHLNFLRSPLSPRGRNPPPPIDILNLFCGGGSVYRWWWCDTKYAPASARSAPNPANPARADKGRGRELVQSAS